LPEEDGGVGLLPVAGQRDSVGLEGVLLVQTQEAVYDPAAVPLEAVAKVRLFVTLVLSGRYCSPEVPLSLNPPAW